MQLVRLIVLVGIIAFSEHISYAQTAPRRSVSSRSFINDVIPALTRSGCNQGTCHGAAAGRGGFKLSLRGYAPELDHVSITRSLRGRRICIVQPDQSLLLRKPLMQIPHMGGQALRPGSANSRSFEPGSQRAHQLLRCTIRTYYPFSRSAPQF